ncbi:hypothetical protein JCM19037_4629 [Geomicrobium sp. JCM 19037]|uniref:LemA family protein n=1 Tax=unclassified Geomicrobium TaxID=2628951 RepID=UPI00045F1CF6|nr:LemA family protein [Geomicrobium sp. JCM 19037]GAK06068.1 hypothetical protein JCM19037_4629 [Geomicrobium sp. JCM 19037]
MDLVFPMILGSIIVVTLLLWFSGYYVLLKFVKKMETRWRRLSHLLHRLDRLSSEYLISLDTDGKLAPGTSQTIQRHIDDMHNPMLGRSEQLHAYAIVHERLEEIFDSVELAEDEQALQEMETDLQSTLTLVASASQAYDASVKRYNKSITTVPTKYVAGIHHFESQYLLDDSVKKWETKDQAPSN